MKITDLKKKIGSFEIDISNWQAQDGKIHGIIGTNGSGKSTFSKLITGVLEKDSGNIDLGGLTQRDITMASQKPYLMHTDVYENVIYPLKIRKMQIDEDYVDYLLEKVGLSDKKKQYALSLSSGEQQKLSFIRAVIFKPEIIVLDETLSNLDPDSVNMFEDMILEIQKEKPITWITISHQLLHIEKICDYVHFMENGKILQSGTVEDMLFRPQNEQLIKFLSNTQAYFKGNSI